MSEKCFEFPAGNYEDNRRLKRILKSISIYLNVPIEIESVTILRAKFNDNETELEALMCRMTSGAGKSKRGRRKNEDDILKPIRLGIEELDPALDPLGS